MTATLPTPDLYVPGGPPSRTPAQISFSYRVEAAADLAQSIATRLYDLAGRSPRNHEALRTLRNIEDAEDVLSRIWVTNLDKEAPADDLDGYKASAVGDEDLTEPRVRPEPEDMPSHRR